MDIYKLKLKNVPQLPEHVSITNEKRRKNEIKQYKIRLTFINFLLSGLLNVKSLISDDLHPQMKQFALFCPFHLCCHDPVFICCTISQMSFY